MVCGRWPKVCIILFSSTGSVAVLTRFVGICFNPFCLPPGAGLNDGQWHSVSLSARGNHLSVMVDGEAASIAHPCMGRLSQATPTIYRVSERNWAALAIKPSLSFLLLPSKATHIFT